MIALIEPSEKAKLCYTLLGVFLALGVLAIDLLIPLGVAGGVAYVAVILVTLWLPSRRYTIFFTVLCSALVVVGFLCSPSGGERWQVVVNRSLALLMLWGTAMLLIWRETTHKALRRSKEQFRRLVEAAPDAVIIVDGEGAIALVNAYAETLFGYERQEILGRPVEVLIPERLRAAHRRYRGQYGVCPYRRPMGRALETVALCKNGCEFPVEITLSPLEGKHGPLTISIVRDITERKQLEERQRWLGHILEDSFTEIYVFDAETLHFVLVNRGAQDNLGYCLAELRQMTPLDLQPAYTPASFAALLEPLHQGKQGQIQFIAAHRRKDGSLYPVEVHLQLTMLDTSSVYVAIVVDITKHKQAEEALVHAQKEAEEMSRLKSALLANMSHEIRTPLTAILGFASILAQEIPEEHRKFIHYVERSGQRLLTTLNSILDLAIFEADARKPNLESINVVEEVHEAIRLLRPSAQEKGLHLHLDASASESYAELDRVFLDQILTNLVGNAIKFTAQGQVVVTVRAVAGCIEIEICDTGIGISEAFIPYIFDAFKQEDTGTARAYEGIGLGLPITKYLVELMGGQIEVESTRGQGSRFTLTFPSVVIEQPVRTAVAREAHSSVEPGRSSARVLAVDDNPGLLALLERYLEETPEVVAADMALDAETALALAQQHPYDVVLMDINLGGGLTGEDVLTDLRRLPAYTRVPVIAVTAYTLPGDRERFLAAGFDDYLGKPFTREQLREMLVQNTVRAWHNYKDGAEEGNLKSESARSLQIQPVAGTDRSAS